MTLPVSLTSLAQMPRIPLDKIRENPITLRMEYDDVSLDELGESIRDRGQIQPIIVQPGDGDWFDLVIGSRRFRSALRRGESEIPGYVIDRKSSLEMLFIALAENLHRVDLNPFEEAQAFLRLMKEYGLDLKAVSSGVNKPEQYIRRRLQLLSMPEDVVTLVSKKQMGLQYVNVLARLPTGEDQVRFARSVVRDRLTEPELRTIIANELNEPQRQTRPAYELTATKVKARLDDFTKFLQKTHRRLKPGRVNSSEKQLILKALQALEDEVRILRASVSGIQVSTPATTVITNLRDDPRNHGQEWPTEHIRRINAPRRPPDEVLAKELGRTVGAIQQMRAKTSEKT